MMMMSMARDLAAELAYEDNSWPESWKPEPGDLLVGKLIRKGVRKTRYGPTEVAVVETDDHARFCVWLSSTVLKGCFDQENPEPGDRVGIRYNGRHETKGYHLYALVVDRGERVPPRSPPASPNRTSSNTVVVRGPRDADPNDPFATEGEQR